MKHKYVIGFGTNDKLVSRLIRSITNGWCSHVWLEYSSITDRKIYVIHATNKGVIRENVVDVWRRYPIRERFNANWNLQLGFHDASNFIGTPYDYGSTLVNMIFLLLNRYTNYVPDDIARNNKLFNCSEFVSYILKVSKIPGHNQLDPEAITPIKLYSICNHGLPGVKNIFNKLYSREFVNRLT